VGGFVWNWGSFVVGVVLTLVFLLMRREVLTNGAG